MVGNEKVNNKFKLSKHFLIYGLINRHILADLLFSCITSNNAGMKNRNDVNDSLDRIYYMVLLEIMSSPNLSNIRNFILTSFALP